MNRIICVCSSATVQDVSKLLKKIPDLNKDRIKEILQIGARCGGCTFGFSPGVEIEFEEALETAQEILKYK